MDVREEDLPPEVVDPMMLGYARQRYTSIQTTCDMDKWTTSSVQI